MWSIEATDLQGHKLDEVYNAANRVFTFGISRVPTAQFTLNTHSDLLVPIQSADVYIKVYAGATLMQHNIPTAIERVADRNNRSTAVTTSGPLWRLSKRLAAKTSTGTLYLSATDRGQIAKDVIDAANVENITGIATGFREYKSYSTTTFKVEPYKPVGEVINELGHALDGFDWEVEPIEYESGYVGLWHAEALIGEQKDAAVFEYGTGLNNIASVEDRVSLDTMANKVYHVHPAGHAQGVVNASDAESIATRGLYEDVASADLTFLETRQSLVEEHTRVRRYPRRVISFTPRKYNRDDPGNVPVYGRDYKVGDWVKAHGRDEGGEWFNGYFRVYQAEVTVDPDESETVKLTLTDEG